MGELAASNFMTGAVLSWAIPIGVLLTVVGWWAVVLVRRALSREGDGL